LPSTAATFVMGSANVYFDARPAPQWRALTETRFSLWPHGAQLFSSSGVTAVDTRFLDFASTSMREPVQWGGIVLERAQIEWTPRDWFSLQAGYFLTPWGIWNVDHGTPTLIGLFLPKSMLDEMVPLRQQGVMAFGSVFRLPYELGYRAFVSNGRVVGQLDLTDDKAVGARVYVSRPGRVSIRLGASGYHGTSGDVKKIYGLDASGQVVASAKTVWASTESVGGLDLSVDWGGLRLRAEGSFRHITYGDGQHEPMLATSELYRPNRNEKAAYVVVAYRFLRHFEPYVFVEGGDTGQRTLMTDRMLSLSGGLNLHFNAAAQLKTQYVDQYYTNNSGRHGARALTSRLVLTF
jgi:hypothetical protein